MALHTWPGQGRLDLRALACWNPRSSLAHQQPETAMASPAADLIVLDTLGKLYSHGHGITGPCRRYFAVPIPILISARGAEGFPLDPG
jgi:hypothetical protein